MGVRRKPFGNCDAGCMAATGETELGLTGSISVYVFGMTHTPVCRGGECAQVCKGKEQNQASAEYSKQKAKKREASRKERFRGTS